MARDPSKPEDVDQTLQITGLPDIVTKKIQSVFRRYPEIDSVILYGSRAKGGMPRAHHYYLAGRWAMVICFVTITWLALTTQDIQPLHTGNDKFNHILAFSVLSFGLYTFWRVRGLLVISQLLTYGILIEVCQSVIPGRYASGLDVLADCVGIFVGLSVAWVVKRMAIGYLK